MRVQQDISVSVKGMVTIDAIRGRLNEVSEEIVGGSSRYC